MLFFFRQFYDAYSSQSYDHDADLSSEDNVSGVDYDQPSNSLDGVLEDMCNAQAESYIPFSPPASSRLAKREKKRNNSGRKQQSFKDFKANAAMEKHAKKSVVSVIKERYSESNALFSGLNHADSDVDLERDNSRENKEKRRKERDEKMKNITKSRQQETFLKRHSEDMTAGSEYSNTAPMEISTPVVPVKLVGSGRFLSLGQNTKSVLLSPISSEKVERRQIAFSARTECPKDRQMFYKTFSALINMGSHGKKKESKEKERILAQRQKSSDEQQYYVTVVWIGLQAWLNGVSPIEQEKFMSKEKEKIPSVLKEVMEFKVQFKTINYLPNDKGNPELMQSSSDTAFNRDSSCSVETVLTDISETYHSLTLSCEIIEQQQEAVILVQKLLGKLDKCEQLFPYSPAFACEYPDYNDPKFSIRIKALYLWLNTTKDLCHKLNVLGQVLNISSVPGFNWPFVDFNSPKGSESFTYTDVGVHGGIPEVIADDGEENEDTYNSASDEEGDSEGKSDVSGNDARKVTFKCQNDSIRSPLMSPVRAVSPNAIGSPPISSTPLKAHLSTSSLSRASSEASLDELGRPSFYRTYVDKGLKKMGLTKMLIRLRDILYRSLRRARQSLEQYHRDAEVCSVLLYFEYLTLNSFLAIV